MEATDFKNVIIAKFPLALFKIVDVVPKPQIIAVIGGFYFLSNVLYITKNFEILTSVTSKMASKPQRPQKRTNRICFEFHF